MTIKRVLGLGTYPIAKPIHGGQRRVAAIKTFYQTIGIDYVHACIYDQAIYAPRLVGPHDLPLVVSSPEYGPAALTGDLQSGHQANSSAESLRHFVKLVEQLKPDALQLEQPFMWPLAKRLREHFGAASLPVIYSSHNVEAPLKRAILTSNSMPSELRHRICDLVERMEEEISESAALIVCVSTSDREHYLQFKPSAIVVAPNGVDRHQTTASSGAAIGTAFAGNRFVFVVGSAYTPNIEGFCEYVARNGIFMCPPTPSIAVCGGVANGVAAHPDYQRFSAAHASRVRFFAEIDDAELSAVKDACHGAILPILTGGGSNLKTAEALALGKWVVATPTALRGFEPFAEEEGVILAKDRTAFRRGIAEVLRAPPLEISARSREARDGLYWDALFARSALAYQLARL